MNEIDINDPSLVNEPVEVDEGSGEDFFQVPLPDDGSHLVVCELGNDGIKVGQQTPEKGGRYFLTAHLALTLIDEGGNRQGMVFDRPNSVVMERNGKRSSRLHALLDLVGAQTGSGQSLPAFHETVEQTFAQNPQVLATTQWQASAKAESEQEVEAAVAAKYAKEGKLRAGNYYTFLKGQRKFPPLDNGQGFNPEVTNPITGETVRAQAVVTGYRRA
jgi:hypothetical protein